MKIPNLAFLAKQEAQKPFLTKLWETFWRDYMHNTDAYPHLMKDGNWEGRGYDAIRRLLFGLAVGVSVASFAAAFHKRVLGGLVRKLIREGCLSEDSAKTLEQLEIKNPILRHAMRKNVSLRRVVHCCEEDAFLAETEKKRTEYEEKRKAERSRKPFREPKFRAKETDRFYIPEELKTMAETKFEAKGTSFVGAVITTVVALAIFLILMIFMPKILTLLNDAVGAFRN